mmetsp:Transcript_92456/g.169701  ORF Transcript_92456/g.169701 Transcript_92456/m.169701 type:complete len:206 (-) Transcript_92456:1135-1752(-)
MLLSDTQFFCFPDLLFHLLCRFCSGTHRWKPFAFFKRFCKLCIFCLNLLGVFQGSKCDAIFLLCFEPRGYLLRLLQGLMLRGCAEGYRLLDVTDDLVGKAAGFLRHGRIRGGGGRKLIFLLERLRSFQDFLSQHVPQDFSGFTHRCLHFRVVTLFCTNVLHHSHQPCNDVGVCFLHRPIECLLRPPFAQLLGYEPTLLEACVLAR